MATDKTTKKTRKPAGPKFTLIGINNGWCGKWFRDAKTALKYLAVPKDRFNVDLDWKLYVLQPGVKPAITINAETGAAEMVTGLDLA